MANAVYAAALRALNAWPGSDRSGYKTVQVMFDASYNVFFEESEVDDDSTWPTAEPLTEEYYIERYGDVAGMDRQFLHDGHRIWAAHDGLWKLVVSACPPFEAMWERMYID